MAADSSRAGKMNLFPDSNSVSFLDPWVGPRGCVILPAGLYTNNQYPRHSQRRWNLDLYRRKNLSASSSSSSNVGGGLSPLRGFFFGGAVACVRPSSDSGGRSNTGEA